MAPNHGDPSTKTFQRSLRLLPDAEGKNPGVSPSFIVRISQPFDSPYSLHLRVFGTESLSPQQQQSLLDQVSRMLRLSDAEERKLRDFWEVYGEAKAKSFGRVFRSPTLFEDMVHASSSATASVLGTYCSYSIDALLEFVPLSDLASDLQDKEDCTSKTVAQRLKRRRKEIQ